MAGAARSVEDLRPYVPQLLSAWQPTHGDSRHMRVEGSLVFVDISGFTKLTERLARKGKVGAEEMSDLLSSTFSALLDVSRLEGADLLKWGGDAVLLLFRGGDHAVRACRAACDMRTTLRTVGRLTTTEGTVTLKMSVGVHSGSFDCYLVGDPDVHEMDYVKQPRATYCRPEIASVGLTQAQCEAQELPFKVGKVPFQAIGKAIIGGEYEGFAKIIGDRKTDDTLGVHVVGPHATDLIAEASLAFQLDATPWEIGAATHPHPTLAEVVGEAAMAVDGRSINF